MTDMGRWVSRQAFLAGALLALGLGGCGSSSATGGTPDAGGSPDGGDQPEVASNPDAGMKAPPIEITLAAQLPRTGDNANDDWISAVTLAVTHMNAAMLQSSTTRPLKFKLMQTDTGSVQAMGLSSMTDFIANGAPVVISEASAAATGANMYNYTAGNTPVPVVAFSATSGDLNNANKTDADPIKQAALQDAGNWFFRTCQLSGNLSSIRYGLIFSKGAGANGDINGDGSVKITWVGTTAATSLSSINGDITSFTAKAPAGVPFIHETVQFDPGTDPTTFNYTNTILQITDNVTQDTGATDVVTDLIYNKALTNVAIPFIKAYKASGRKIPMFQDGSFRRNTILVALGTSAEGQEGVSNVAYESTTSGQTFAAAEQAVTHFPPAAYEAQAYDAAILSMMAVAKVWFGDPTLTTTVPSDGVRVALGELNDPAGTKFGAGPTDLAHGLDLLAAGAAVNYDGASGPVDFNAVGDVVSRAVWWVVENGRFVEKKVYDCIASPSCPETTF